MKLREFEGKELFKKYGIEVPKSELLSVGNHPSIGGPLVLKAQVFSGDRKKYGGISFPDVTNLKTEIDVLFNKEIQGEKIEKILVEERLDIEEEYYASISYDTIVRGPVLAITKSGGSGISEAITYSLNVLESEIPAEYLNKIFSEVGFVKEDFSKLADVIQKLWKLFLSEYALLAEINPIIKTKDGRFIAGDSKIILDDEKINPNERRFVSMGGDIAILASGGGASMLNIDALLEYGGKPANYTEYSGNPKADVVKDLTRRVLEQTGINGLWVIGGTANFTDIYETMSGFIEGLESLSKKPDYPIVIRRDGPRQKEAEEMLKKFAKEKGYNMHVYGGDVPMETSARIIVDLANQYRSSKT